MNNDKIAMEQKIKTSYIEYGILKPGRIFQKNFPSVGGDFEIQADNMTFIVHLDEQNRIAFKKWPGWSKVKQGDTIILYELISGRKYRLEHISRSSGFSTVITKTQKGEYNDNYDEEQKQIIEIIKKEFEGLNEIEDGDWNKYKGAITTRVIISHIKPYLPENLTIVGHDYFIRRNSNEWDAMIVKKDALPHPIFNTYKLADVKAVIEIKLSGFYDRTKSSDGIKKLRNNFNKMKVRGIKSMLVVIRTASEIADREINAFALSNWNWKTNNYKKEWKRLVEFIRGIE